MQEQIILEMKNINKQFPKILANDNISIDIKKGEILSLLGENGAGKSTLMNILYGLYKPSSGRIILNNKDMEFQSPKDAIKAGLGMVHQHFMLIDNLTAIENIVLGMEPGKSIFFNYKKARQEVLELSKSYQLDIEPDAKIESLSVGPQQRVEILKTLYRKAKILILDEPTAVLTPQEVVALFEIIRKLRDTGVSIIIITHKLAEVLAISDRVYILRRGKLMGERNTKEITKGELANLMVGRNVVLTVKKKKKNIEGDPVFMVENLHIKSDTDVYAISELSFNVRPGEIMGIAGVDGNGQRELAEALIGLRKVEKGKIQFNDREITHLSTKKRIACNLSYVPADRQNYGLVLPMKVSENLIIGYHDRKPFIRGINLDFKAITEYSKKLVDKYDIRTSSVHEPVSNLSGGNQQKVILAREFSRKPKFLLISQPTRGLDVGAIEYIHSQILSMRDLDVAILLISLELEEIFSLADRIMVIYEGSIVKELIPEETTEKEVGLYMTGGKK